MVKEILSERQKRAIKFFEENTGIKYNDLPEGVQTISTTFCIQLMAAYKEPNTVT